MIKRFRRRFIIITMVLIAIVSLLACLAIGFFDYQSQADRIDQALTDALDDEGISAALPDMNPREDEGGRYPSENIPIYCVTVMPDGNVYEDASSTAQIDESYAVDVINIAVQSEDSDGYIDDYGLLYKSKQERFGEKIAFTTYSTLTQGVGRTARTLLIVWLLLLVAMFVVTLFLARYVSRPVQQAWDNQQRFIADASHELKTPLAIILADSCILADNPTKTVAEQSTWVEGITEEAKRMQSLTEDMLTLTSADVEPTAKPITAKVDFSQLIERSILQFEALAYERGISIEDSVQPGLHVQGDESALDRLVKTLLDNACKYAESPGTVDVTLHEVKSQAVLEVHNTGNPISQEDLPHVFERFYRSDSSRVQEGASASFGLGLAIARSTAESHGGTISATSDEDGTTFTVKLPLAR
ncbi:MAG: HAMP domain-containing histidine kinase [Coriobacteriaceae bacterium]|nr:HAMP domain-containing histidine kinase [Coriobacteriaceae bacterium]